MNISNEPSAESVETAAAILKEKIVMRGDLPYATVERQLSLLSELGQFPLGRHLILHQGGLNGHWTHHVLTCRKSEHPLERFLITRAPVIRATQERFQIFQQLAQAELREGMSLASIPCGLMGDLLYLNYRGIKNFSLTGIDLDPEAIKGARELAEKRELLGSARFLIRDAWNLGLSGEFDLLLSNGLNIYEKSDEKNLLLYRQFYDSLKKGGVLITSFLTPPPGMHHRCEWNMDKISMEDLLLQKVIAADILEAKWQSFQTPEQISAALEKAGFQDIEILFDEARIFPTIKAKKI